MTVYNHYISNMKYNSDKNIDKFDNVYERFNLYT